MVLYDHEGTRGLAPLSILGQPPMPWDLGPRLLPRGD